ncbi:MAG: hypothetical protein K2K70_07765 [Lachnospiraceae bacterium]|nr:hypothetical protein [Lachnospiraceae bacterium]
MKHFFPFLTVLLILCVLLHNSFISSVSAQQHNSFASAKSLSLDHSVSISLPANATEYYYFYSLQLTDYTDQKYQITLSDASSISVSAYDDQGSAVNLKQADTSASHWTGYIDNISNNTRFFLLLHNQAEQDVSIRLSVKRFRSAKATPKSNKSAKKAATAKPDKKSKPSSSTKKSTTQKPKNSPASKVNHTQIPQNTSRQNFGTKLATTQKPRNISGQLPDTKATTSKPQSNYPMNHSRSNSILSTHFFRMSVGYSISAFELLPINSSDSQIILESLTPEKLSLQNNIIYTKATGLAVIKIYSGNDITSCTIYIQEPPERGN